MRGADTSLLPASELAAAGNEVERKPRSTSPVPFFSGLRPGPLSNQKTHRSSSMRLRLVVALTVTMLVMGGAFVLFTLQLTRADQEELTEATLTAQAQLLREVLARKGDAAIAAAERLAAVPALVEAVMQRDSASMGTLLRALAAQQPDLLQLAVADAQERLLGAARSGIASSATGAGEIGTNPGHAVAGVGQDSRGALTLQAVVPVWGTAGKPPIGALLLQRSLDDTVAAVEAATSSGVLLLDSRNQVAAAGPSLNSTEFRDVLAAMTFEGKTGLRTTQFGSRTLAASAVPLLSAAGGRLGTELQLRDVTDSGSSRRFLTVVATQLLAVVLILMALIMIYVTDQTFRPLASVVAGLHALTRGDTEIELEGEGRHDEIGEIAHSVSVLRDRSRELARYRLRQERNRRRQHRMIRQQLTEMGAALDMDSRADIEADTRSIEDALLRLESGEATTDADELGVLALAFRITAQRVIAQYGRLDALVGQLREALKQRTELIGLQQQIAFATDMQADLLPQALPPRPDVQVRGGLLPAAAFGGDFYDFFPLGPNQIAVVAGTASGTGLQSAFLTLTARTLLKAVLTCGVAPGAAMSRVNALLAAEKGVAEGVGALVLLLDLVTSRVTGCNAGYPAPLLLRRLGDAVAMTLPPGPRLGQRAAAEFAEARMDLPPRTTVLVHSPGLSGGDENRLPSALAACLDPGAEAVLNAMMSAATQVRDDRHDASCVVLRYAAAL